MRRPREKRVEFIKCDFIAHTRNRMRLIIPMCGTLCVEIISIVAKQDWRDNIKFANRRNEILQYFRVAIFVRVKIHDSYPIPITRIEYIPIPTLQDIFRKFSPEYRQSNSHGSLQPDQGLVFARWRESVNGVPSRVKRLRMAARTCSPATWQSNSRAVTFHRAA
jgi:hypothetical protein